jgi:hypothetical protein
MRRVVASVEHAINECGKAIGVMAYTNAQGFEVREESCDLHGGITSVLT